MTSSFFCRHRRLGLELFSDGEQELGLFRGWFLHRLTHGVRHDFGSDMARHHEVRADMRSVQPRSPIKASVNPFTANFAAE